MLNTLKSRLAAMKAAPSPINGLLEKVDDCREQVAVLKAERDRTARSPRPASEILDLLDDHLDKLATDAVDGLNLNSMTNRANSLALRLPFRTDRETATIDSSAACSVLLGLIIATSRPAIRQIIEGQISDLTRDRPGLSDDALAARLAALDREITAAELAEESAIRQLEASGINILRRADASPLAVLADDSALPSM